MLDDGVSGLGYYFEQEMTNINRRSMLSALLAMPFVPSIFRTVEDKTPAYERVFHEQIGEFDITCPTGWMVTHGIDNDGLHVIRASSRLVTVSLPDPKGCFPKEPHGFRRHVRVTENIFSGHWDVCITDQEIEKGGRIANLNVMDGGTCIFE